MWYDINDISPRPLWKRMHTWGHSVIWGNFMPTKDFKTIDEQLKILCSRGLTIEDREKAADFLIRNNYYRVSGYSLTLRNHDVFAPQATFQNIMDIYNFDYHLRHILLHYIELIETAFKSIYAYKFAQDFGPLGYKNSLSFTDYKVYVEVLTKVNEVVNKNKNTEVYLKHFLEDLNGEIPFWAYVECFSIADISRLYTISKGNLKTEVAKSFGLEHSNGTDILENYMHCMTILRNMCAHGRRIFNRLFVTKPSLNSREKKLLLTTTAGEKDNAHLFGYILVMRRLLPPAAFSDMLCEIKALKVEYPFVAMRYYGFPSNWQEVL